MCVAKMRQLMTRLLQWKEGMEFHIYFGFASLWHAYEFILFAWSALVIAKNYLFILVNIAVNGLLFLNFYLFQSNHTWIISNIISSSEAEIVSHFDSLLNVIFYVKYCCIYLTLIKGSSDYQRSPNPKWWGTPLINIFEFMLIFELPLALMQSAPSLD